MGKMLSQQMKEQVFDIFEDYEEELNLIRAYDWADRRNKALEFLQAGTNPRKKYDVILVDEAQHFAPNWMNILYFFLKPNGSLFICDDPSQSVYRFFSWKQKGVDVVGRTRWLRVPYRNTKQIFRAAFSLIASDSLAQTLLQEDEVEILAALDHYDLREGPKPKVCSFSSVSSEKAFIKKKVEVLLDEGFVPEEIGVLHTQQHVVKMYKALLPRGVNVYEARRQTGLEYSVVFIPQIQNLLKREASISYQEDQSRQRMMAYMMMARARSDLYLSYQQKWPTILDPLREHVAWCDEKDL